MNPISLPLASPWPRRPDGRPYLMGIVNVTPDSFSDGGYFAQTEAALAHCEELVTDGADILDIGGESTRPGAQVISEDEEMARVLPVISTLKARSVSVPISIDTYKAATAAAALSAGATIVNDVWGFQRDPQMARIVAEYEAGAVLMHNRETKDERIDIVEDMERFFERSLDLARVCGVRDDRIALDPGIGFGKTQEQNLAAIRAIPRLRALGFPLLLGVSRKSFLGLITNRPVSERLAGSVMAAMIGVELGADILRVHDIGPHLDALAVRRALA